MPKTPEGQVRLSLYPVLQTGVETEEANTSAASYLDGDSLPEHGKKPQGWKPSGKRVKRGLYRTKDKSLVNADLQASANILRKVAGNLGLDLRRLSRLCLTTAGRIKIWFSKSNSSPKESPLMRGRGESTEQH